MTSGTPWQLVREIMGGGGIKRKIQQTPLSKIYFLNTIVDRVFFRVRVFPGIFSGYIHLTSLVKRSHSNLLKETASQMESSQPPAIHQSRLFIFHSLAGLFPKCRPINKPTSEQGANNTIDKDRLAVHLS